MNIDEKRQIEAQLTSRFIQANTEQVKTLAKMFSVEIKNIDPSLMSNFYLKGGNAISVLKGGKITGDYDFQFVPTSDLYKKWSSEIGALDGIIIGAMRNAITKYSGDELNTSALDCKNVETLVKEIQDEEIRNTVRVTEKSFVKSIRRIGKSYLVKSYIPVASEALKNADKRVKLNDGEFETIAKEIDKAKIPVCVYVNCCIPGFILYRLVYKKEYEITVNGETETVSLKSEIIDLTIPRAGSGEVYMSQEGVVTHFREKDDFIIPGWGYHFYENINLLQEIELGISGSPHKKSKREERLQEAAAELVKANGGADIDRNIDTILPKNINEPMETTDGTAMNKILGYFGAMSNSFKHYNVFDKDAIEELSKRLYTNVIKSYFETDLSNMSISHKWQLLYKFKISDDFKVTANKINSYISCLQKNFQGNSASKGCNLAIRCLTPALSISPPDKGRECGFTHAIYDVDLSGTEKNPILSLLKCFTGKNELTNRDGFKIIACEPKNEEDKSDKNYMLIKGTVKSSSNKTAIIYILFQYMKASEKPVDCRKLAEDMLRDSIIESQRYPLTLYIQGQI